MDNAIEKWRILNADKKYIWSHMKKIRDEWILKDKTAKFLGMFSSPRFYKH